MTLVNVHLDFAVEMDAEALLHRVTTAREEQEEPARDDPKPPGTRSPPAARVARRRTNDQADPVPEQTATAAVNPAPGPTIQIPPEAELRPLLSRMAAVHFDRIRGVTDMLERVGGAKRLAECPPNTWPAIKQACEDAILAAGG